MPTKQGQRNLQNNKVVAPPANTMLNRRTDSFYDLVQKSRELDKRIKAHRDNKKPLNERIEDLEEFHKLSQKMEDVL